VVKLPVDQLVLVGQLDQLVKNQLHLGNLELQYYLVDLWVMTQQDLAVPLALLVR
jgi:hypothetical protein